MKTLHAIQRCLCIALAVSAAAFASGLRADDSPRGEAVYRETCAACHGTGVPRAPRFGDKASWAPLLKEGQARVTAHGWVGMRGMPPRGGRDDLTLEAFAEAVAHMARSGGGDWTTPDAGMLERIRHEEKKRRRQLDRK